MSVYQKQPTQPEVFTAGEVARAAGVPVCDVLRLVASGQIPTLASPGIGGLRPGDTFMGLDDAVMATRLLAGNVSRAPHVSDAISPRPLFSAPALAHRSRALPIAVSSTLHVGMVACVVLVTTLGLAPEAATRIDPAQDDRVDMHLLFLALPGPGGGGGGGGLRQRMRPPQAQRAGTHAINSPLPARRVPEPIVEVEQPVDPPPPAVLKSEPFPAIIAPVVVAPGTQRDRIGVFEPASSRAESRGAGESGGVGTGRGTGLGDGDGSGIGSGSGGGTGGGPYRSGSGIAPPRLVREVKADYTEDARRRGVEGEVVLEIIVRRDGTVGEVKLVHGLVSGLDERAIAAVRQWRFTPARRLGQPVDVIVEVAVEFRIR